MDKLISYAIRLMGLILAAGLSAGAIIAWNYPALLDWQDARETLGQIERRVESEQGAIAALKRQQERMETDSTALEQAAREEYLLLRPGEEVYVFERR